MVDGGKFIFQLLRAALGFAVAVICCGVFLAWGFFGQSTGNEDPAVLPLTIGSGLISASMIGGTVFIPSLVFIVLAEVASLRSIIYHVGMAGAMAFVLWTLGTGTGTEDLDFAMRPGTSIALAAGFIGGFAYWLVAGRKSGCWKTEVPEA